MVRPFISLGPLVQLSLVGGLLFSSVWSFLLALFPLKHSSQYSSLIL